MSAVPAGLETEAEPPLAVPLAHFLAALGFLVAGALLGALGALGLAPGTTPAHAHLLAVGWVTLTIMGAMTQFVPVWSGTPLYARRLAWLQLPAVGLGVAGLATAMFAGWTEWLPVAGAVVLAGVWTFAYGLARTLARARPWDATEWHFLVALAGFTLATAAGFALAAATAWPLLADLPVTWVGLRDAHVTLAVYGGVVATILGALDQLDRMFTQVSRDRLDRALRRAETAAYPAGVLALAAGRLLGVAPLARAGGLLVAGGVLVAGAVLGRHLLTARVPWTPMLRRYAVVAAAAVAWAVLAAHAWWRAPLAPAARFGAPGFDHLLFLGVVGFVVVGTLYHAVPFLVWLERYGDDLGLRAVPAVEDLYDERLETADFWALLAGTAGLLAGTSFGRRTATAAAGVLLVAGLVAFCANLLLVVVRHGPRRALAPWTGGSTTEPPGRDGP